MLQLQSSKFRDLSLVLLQAIPVELKFCSVLQILPLPDLNTNVESELYICKSLSSVASPGFLSCLVSDVLYHLSLESIVWSSSRLRAS